MKKKCVYSCFVTDKKSTRILQLASFCVINVLNMVYETQCYSNKFEHALNAFKLYRSQP